MPLPSPHPSLPSPHPSTKLTRRDRFVRSLRVSFVQSSCERTCLGRQLQGQSQGVPPALFPAQPPVRPPLTRECSYPVTRRGLPKPHKQHQCSALDLSTSRYHGPPSTPRPARTVFSTTLLSVPYPLVPTLLSCSDIRSCPPRARPPLLTVYAMVAMPAACPLPAVRVRSRLSQCLLVDPFACSGSVVQRFASPYVHAW